MPSGCILEQFGAPRHYSLPPLVKETPKPKLVIGHCDKWNLFYLRDPAMRVQNQQKLQQVAFMRYKKVKDNQLRLDGMHVPESMKGRGISNILAREILNHMVERDMWIEAQCPVVKDYIQHNQYAQYIRRMRKANTVC